MKLIANKMCQGFRGKLWEKDEQCTVSENEVFPKEHFDRADGKPHADTPPADDKKSEKGKPKAPPAGDPPADDKK